MTKARELLQRAQEAELEGDTSAAVGLLLQAADASEEAGNPGRALKLLRHALRLDARREDLAQRVRQLEAGLPLKPEEEQPPHGRQEVLGPVEGAEALEAAAREALAHLEQREGVEGETAPPRGRPMRRHAFVQRGPTLAEPTLEAWCSFCCRPRREVGPLVAGPAGAFVCAACAEEAVRLLGSPGGAPGRDAVGQGPLIPSLRGEGRGGGPRLFGREATLAAVAAAQRLGATCLLLVGAEGAGRSTCLGALARERGAPVVTPASLSLPALGPLFVDDADALPEGLVRALDVRLHEEPGLHAFLVARGRPQAAPHLLPAGAGGVPLWTSAALSAVAPSLPAVLAGHVQQLVPVTLPTQREVERLAEHLLSGRGPQVSAGPALVAWLAAQALCAPRLLHELVALVRRLPPGAWKEAPAVPPEESLP